MLEDWMISESCHYTVFVAVSGAFDPEIFMLSTEGI